MKLTTLTEKQIRSVRKAEVIQTDIQGIMSAILKNTDTNEFKRLWRRLQGKVAASRCLLDFHINLACNHDFKYVECVNYDKDIYDKFQCPKCDMVIEYPCIDEWRSLNREMCTA